ncbi:MAG: hypothetical protein LBI05_06430 [Planctomycetaceae bacterium]|jgi:hypothetical protein|nr:hypothetical protein [Planctomycetaceae bacterium]
MTKEPTIVGLAYIIDFNDDKTTCRVRLCDENGLPTGKVLTGVKYLPGATPVRVPLPDMPQWEQESMAWQNIRYNSHRLVEIE